MKGLITDNLRISHIFGAIAEVEKYLHNVSVDSFLQNSEKRFATIKQIEIIGEACNRLSETVKNKLPEVDWRAINGFRNISIHEYFGVDSTRLGHCEK